VLDGNAFAERVQGSFDPDQHLRIIRVLVIEGDNALLTRTESVEEARKAKERKRTYTTILPSNPLVNLQTALEPKVAILQVYGDDVRNDMHENGEASSDSRRVNQGGAADESFEDLLDAGTDGLGFAGGAGVSRRIEGGEGHVPRVDMPRRMFRVPITVEVTWLSGGDLSSGRVSEGGARPMQQKSQRAKGETRLEDARDGGRNLLTAEAVAMDGDRGEGGGRRKRGHCGWRW
jgi:hypothetical protein